MTAEHHAANGDCAAANGNGALPDSNGALPNGYVAAGGAAAVEDLESPSSSPIKQDLLEELRQQAEGFKATGTAHKPP